MTMTMADGAVHDDIKIMERAHPKSERSNNKHQQLCLFPIKYANRKHTLTPNSENKFFFLEYSVNCLVYQKLICIGN